MHLITCISGHESTNHLLDACHLTQVTLHLFLLFWDRDLSFTSCFFIFFVAAVFIRQSTRRKRRHPLLFLQEKNRKNSSQLKNVQLINRISAVVLLQLFQRNIMSSCLVLRISKLTSFPLKWVFVAYFFLSSKPQLFKLKWCPSTWELLSFSTHTSSNRCPKDSFNTNCCESHLTKRG